MTLRTRLTAVALAAALAACGDSSDVAPGLLLSQPSAVAAFRAASLTGGAGVQRYLAVANSGTNDLTILNAADDSIVLAPIPLRPLVLPVGQRPALLVSAELGDDDPENLNDDKPDLLVAVSAGGSTLQVVRTWDRTGDVAGEVDLEGTVLALVAVPSPSGTARIAAALSGRRLAVAEFTRATSGDLNAIVSPTVPVPTATLNYQPVALAAMPGGVLADETRVWAASPDLPGVGAIDVPLSGAPVSAGELVAGAPTRLVAAARLAERGIGADRDRLDPADWTTLTPVERVYAVLDESGCGIGAEPPCGLVALDPGTGGLAPDFRDGTPTRAAIPIPGRAVALAASGPPAKVPEGTDPKFAPPFMWLGVTERVLPDGGSRRTTGVAAVASSDGSIYFVDLGRWELPTDQLVHEKVGATVTVQPPAGGAATDPISLSTSVTVVPGFTPSDRFTVTREGVLPGLGSRRAEIGSDGGGPWLALHARSGASFSEVVHLDDPAVGVRFGTGEAGDIVVVTDPQAVGSCAPTYEVRATALVTPTGAPGGAMRVIADPRWTGCAEASVGRTNLRATVRAGGYVLTRGKDAAVIQLGRPVPGDEFAVDGPRLSYVAERCGDTACTTRWGPFGGLPDPVGPALAFTLTVPAGPAPARDSALHIDTVDGRTPFRAVDPVGFATEPRSVVAFDRSAIPGREASGVRFLVPYASNVVLDVTPSAPGGGAAALR